MGKKANKNGKYDPTKAIVLATTILALIKEIIDLIEKLID